MIRTNLNNDYASGHVQVDAAAIRVRARETKGQPVHVAGVQWTRVPVAAGHVVLFSPVVAPEDGFAGGDAHDGWHIREVHHAHLIAWPRRGRGKWRQGLANDDGSNRLGGLGWPRLYGWRRNGWSDWRFRFRVLCSKCEKPERDERQRQRSAECPGGGQTAKRKHCENT